MAQLRHAYDLMTAPKQVKKDLSEAVQSRRLVRHLWNVARTSSGPITFARRLMDSKENKQRSLEVDRHRRSRDEDDTLTEEQIN